MCRVRNTRLSVDLLSVTPELYDERHVQDLVGSEGNGESHGSERSSGALYNPAIPIDPPKVCTVELTPLTLAPLGPKI